MNISKAVLACVAPLVLSQAPLAQIYESKDAQGNTVFSDTPANTQDKAVELSPTNIAEPVEEAPRSREEAAPAAPASAATPEGDDVVIIGDAHNERLEREIREHRRDEVRDAQPRQEVGDGENMSATHREYPERAVHPAPHPKPARHR